MTDEWIAEVERLVRAYGSACIDGITLDRGDLLSSIAKVHEIWVALNAHLRAHPDTKDAERYRALRTGLMPLVDAVGYSEDGHIGPIYGANLDAAIDKAMKEK